MSRRGRSPSKSRMLDLTPLDPLRILCWPELASLVRGCLPGVWHTAEIVPVQPDVTVEDLFDPLVGHLAGRQQPTDMPCPRTGRCCFDRRRHSSTRLHGDGWRMTSTCTWTCAWVAIWPTEWQRRGHLWLRPVPR
jgi:hypothetical protein